MKMYPILILGLCILACGKKNKEVVYVDQENFVIKKHLQSIIEHPTPNDALYADFDLWSFSPLAQITTIDTSFKKPVLEIIKNDSGIIQLIIVHANASSSFLYVYSDSLYVSMDEQHRITMKRKPLCPCENSYITVNLRKDSIITTQWYEGEYNDSLKKNPYYLRTVNITRKNAPGNMYLYFEEYDYQYDNHTAVLYYENTMDWRPGDQILPFYDLEFTETVEPFGNEIKIKLFTEGYNYATDTGEYEAFDPKKDKTTISEKYVFEAYPYFLYRNAKENKISFPHLKKVVYLAEPILYFQYRSYFWFLWETKWRNNSLLCDPDCTP